MLGECTFLCEWNDTIRLCAYTIYTKPKRVYKQKPITVLYFRDCERVSYVCIYNWAHMPFHLAFGLYHDLVLALLDLNHVAGHCITFTLDACEFALLMIIRITAHGLIVLLFVSCPRNMHVHPYRMCLHRGRCWRMDTVPSATLPNVRCAPPPRMPTADPHHDNRITTIHSYSPTP